VARTPSKLRTLLQNEHEIPAATIDSQLTIVKGSIKDLAPVKETLVPSGKPASIVISGVGSFPKFQFSYPLFTMDDPHLCEEGLQIILAALRELSRENIISEAQKPLVCVISTTGLSDKRDVPYLSIPLYHILLKTAHKDKEQMERVVASASTETGSDAPTSGFVIVRPTLLVDGPAKGIESVKSGWEKHPSAPNAVAEEETEPAIGYTIRRADVGTWVFKSVVKDGRQWAGKCVSLAY